MSPESHSNSPLSITILLELDPIPNTLSPTFLWTQGKAFTIKVSWRIWKSMGLLVVHLGTEPSHPVQGLVRKATDWDAAFTVRAKIRPRSDRLVLSPNSPVGWGIEIPLQHSYTLCLTQAESLLLPLVFGIFICQSPLQPGRTGAAGLFACFPPSSYCFLWR